MAELWTSPLHSLHDINHLPFFNTKEDNGIAKKKQFSLVSRYIYIYFTQNKWLWVQSFFYFSGYAGQVLEHLKIETPDNTSYLLYLHR